jgi:hypothetical protein
VADLGEAAPVVPAADLVVDRVHLVEGPVVAAEVAATPAVAAHRDHRHQAADAECPRGRGSSWRRMDSDLRVSRRVRDCLGSKDLPAEPAGEVGVVARTDSAEADTPAVVEAPEAAEVRPNLEAARSRLVRVVVRRDSAAAAVVPAAARTLPAVAEVAAVEADPNPAGKQQEAAVRETFRGAERPKRAAERHTKRRTCSWAYSKCRSAGTRSSSPTSERAKNTGRCRPVSKRGQHTRSVPDRIVRRRIRGFLYFRSRGSAASSNSRLRRLFRRGCERPCQPGT